MTFEDYKANVDRLTAKVRDLGITLSNGREVPTTFWKTFFGVARKVHQEVYNGTYKVRNNRVPGYLVRSLRLCDLLTEETFAAEVKSVIPEFEADKAS